MRYVDLKKYLDEKGYSYEITYEYSYDKDEIKDVLSIISNHVGAVDRFHESRSSYEVETNEFVQELFNINKFCFYKFYIEFQVIEEVLDLIKDLYSEVDYITIRERAYSYYIILKMGETE